MQTDATLLANNTQQCWELLALVATVCRGLKGPCKRTQPCWPTTPNIVGPNNVVTCCARLHGTTTMLALVAYSLKPVKLLGPCNRTQHCWPTTPNNVGSCWHLLRPFAGDLKAHANGLNIVGQQHPTLLGPTML